MDPTEGESPTTELIKAALLARQKLAQRNMAAMQDPTVRTLPPERMAALLGNRGQSFANVAQADPYADTPEDTARKAALSKLRLSSKVRQTDLGPAAGTGEVSGGDSFTRQRMQSLLSGVNQTARKQQGDNARARAKQLADASGAYANTHPGATPAEIAAYGGGRPTAEGNRLKRADFMRKRAEALAMSQARPMLEAIAAQHGMRPDQAAQARLHNAQAQLYEHMQQGGVPGAPQAGAQSPQVPGAPAPQPGITQRPMTAWERWMALAQGSGNPDPYSAMPIPGQ